MVLSLMLILLVFVFPNLSLAQTQTYTTSGSFIVPAGVTSITVECWGGGGSGGGSANNTVYGGGGGAGGSYARSVLTVTPGNTYTVTVATRQTGVNGAGSKGNPTWFGSVSTVYAEGGAGGAEATGGTSAGGIGSIANTIGTIRRAGGNGSAGNASGSGAGGGAADYSSNGGSASGLVAGIGTLPNGGNGGDGRINEGNGRASNVYGGGGGGAFITDATNHKGGRGEIGLVIVTWALPPTTKMYRTQASGNWSNISIWQSSTNGGATWSNATTYPNSADLAINIRSPHTVSITTTDINIDQATIDAGAQLTINSGQTLTILDGSGTDLTVNGKIVNYGSIVKIGSIAFNSGSIYEHQIDGDNLPVATWDANSNCNIYGATANEPVGFAQSFGNLTWDCAGQTSTMDFSGRLTSVNGNLSILNSNDNWILLGDDGYTMNISGNFILGNGTNIVKTRGSNLQTACTNTINLSGDFIINANANFNSRNNANVLNFNFTKTGIQNFINNGSISGNVFNFGVNSGSTLNISSYLLDGSSGTFILNSGASITTTHPEGLSISGSTGSIQVSGIRTYASGANYTYNGTVAQVTGDGLSQNTPAQLTINNAAGVTLSTATTISGLLTMTNGSLNLDNYDLSTGSLTGIGNLTATTGTRTLTVGSDNTSPAAYTGIISNGTATSVAISKTGNGTLVMSGSNTYTGGTTITGGTLRLGAANRLADGGSIVLNGGTLSTGATTGYTETVGTLALNNNSTIALGTGNHSLTFANSSAVAWTGITLTITGWTGTAGATGTAGKIYVGVGGLTSTQLAKITFSGAYPAGAIILAGTGELVPQSTTASSATDYFRSNVTSGNWSTPASWQSSADGITWYTATLAPTNAATSINIQSGHTVFATVTPSSANLTVNGTYEHRLNGGTIPSATWNVTSTCNVTGITNTSPIGFNQTFGNFIWNSNNTVSLTTDGNMAVNGNYILANGIFTLASGVNRNLTIAGNYLQTGGTFDFNSSPSGIATMYIGGNFTNTAPLNDNMITNGAGANNGQIVFNGSVLQTFSFSNVNAASWIAYSINTGSTVQLLSNLSLYGDSSDPKYYADITVNGTINVGTYTISDGAAQTNASHFILNAGAHLITANTAGINGAFPSGTMSTSYNTGANYTYNGTAAQVTGSGLTQNTPANLTISNTSGVLTGVTLSAATTITGTLTLNNGNLTTTATNLLSLTNTATTAISGGSSSSYINGPVRRSLPASLVSGSTYNFPVGKTSYLPFSLVNPTTGTGAITAQVEAVNANSGGSIDGTLASKSTTEYWSLATVGNFTNSSISISRPTAITPLNTIGTSTTLGGTYTTLNGTIDTYGISASNPVGANRFFALAQKNQAITIGAIAGSPFCAGVTGINVPFTYTPTINFAGSTFTAQLSDASGSFAAPTPLQNVTYNATGSQSINVTVPGATPSGVSYKIRINSTSPALNSNESPVFEVINGAANVTLPAASAGNALSSLSWTNPSGCFDEILIVAKAGTSISATPTGDGSAYTANLAFASGTAFGGGYVVYKGLVSPKIISALTNGTLYYFKFFTRKGTLWSTGIEVSVTPNAASQTTDYFRSNVTSGNWNTPATWQSSPDGITWNTATLAPTSAANSILIQSGHTVTQTANATAKNLTINGSLSQGTFTLTGTGTMTVSNGGTLLLAGANNFPTGFTTTTLSTGSTVNYNNTGNQTVSPRAYSNLILSGSGTKTTTGVSVNEILSMEGTATASSAPTFGTAATLQYNTATARTAGIEWITPFAATGGVIIAGTGTITLNQAKVLNDNVPLTINNGATLDVTNTNYQLTVGGNFTNNGTYTARNGTFIMSGTGRTIGGTTQTTFYNLQINNAGGTLLGNSQTVSNTLTLTSGRLTLGAYNLTLSGANAVAGTLNSSNMVVTNGTGQLRKTYTATGAYTFPVGDATGTAEYSPITVTFSVGTFGGGAYAGVRVTNAKHPNNGSNSNYLNRYWSISQSGISGFTANVTGTYLPADLSGSRGYQVMGQYNGSLPWIKHVTLSDQNYNAIAFSTSSFGDFTGITVLSPTVSISANPRFSVGIGESTTLTATPVGDGPFTYSWSPGGATTASFNPSTASSGTTNYSVTVTDANGFTGSSARVLTVSKLKVSIVRLTGFAYAVGNGPSAEQIVYVSASGLTGNLLLTAPSDFEISKTSGFGFSSSLTITPSGGTINSTPIYVRLKAGLTLGYTNQYLVLTSAGCQTVSVNCVGTVLPSIKAFGGGYYCTGTTITLSSISSGVTSQYWTGPSSFYSTATSPTVTTSAAASHVGTYTIIGNALSGNNLVTNGDFSAGNTGFGSSYGYAADVGGNAELYPEGLYSVTTLGSNVHNNFNSVGDDPPAPLGTGNQMIVNGATSPGAAVWTQSCDVIQNADFEYTYWIQTVVNGTDANPAQLQLFVNGVAAGPIKVANPTSGTWTQFIYNWNSGGYTTANLSLVNQNIIAGGNDFSLDNIVFQQVYSNSSSVNVSVGGATAASISISADPGNTICSGSSVTFTASASGGASPSYQWKVNGANVGTNSPTYTSSTLTNGNSVTCTLTKDASQFCMTNSPVTSTAIVMSVTGPATITSSGAIATKGYSASAQTSTLAYTATTNSPISYYIDWDAAANTAGLDDQSITAYTFASGGGTINNIEITAGTPAGTYSGTMGITNATGCPGTKAVTLTISSGPTITTTGTITAQCFSTGAQTSSLTYSATTNSPTSYSIDWNATANTAGLADQGSTAFAFAPGGGTINNIALTANTPAGNYSGTMTISNGNTTTQAVTLQVKSTPQLFNPGNQTSCVNYTLPTITGVTLSGSEAYYTGVSGSGTMYTAGQTIASSQSLYIYDINSGCADEVSFSITITPLPTASISYAGTPFCKTVATAQTVTLSGTGAYTGGTYSSTAGLTINASTGAITPSTSTAGTYTVTYTVPASGGCSTVTTTTSVTITTLPVATFSYTATPYCSNAANPSPTFSGGGVAGTFSSTAGLNFVSTATGQINLASSTPGTYTVTNTIAAAGGCAIVTATSPITITALPTTSISYAGTPFCKNVATAQAVTLSGTGAYTGGTYSSTAGLSINSSTGAITPSTSTAGTYTITYTIPAANGCGIVTATTSVTITVVPTATISYAGTPFCKTVATGQAVTLSGTGAYTGGTYSSTAGLSINSSTGAITPSTSTAGTYTVTYTVPASGGCATVPATTSVTITTLPVATFSYTATPYCSNAANPSPTFSGGGVAGTFSSTAGLNFVSTATGQINLASSTPGTYTVTNTIAAAGGCAIVTATSPITITVLPTATISYTGTPFCATLATGQAVTLSGTGAYTGGTYSSTAGLTINASTGAITPSTSTEGTYTITYTIAAAGGCGIVTAIASVYINRLNLAVSDVSTDIGSDCPDFLAPFNADNGSYDPGVSEVVFRVSRQLSLNNNWTFDFTLSGTNVTAYNLTLIGDDVTTPSQTSGNNQSGSINAGNNSYVDLTFEVVNLPGTSLDIILSISNISDGICTGETEVSSGSDNTETHTLEAMPSVGSFN